MTDATQLSLFGRPRKPAGPIRIAPRPGLDPVFFAVLVGASIRPKLEAIIAAQRENRVTAPLLPAETLHISLVGVGFYQHLTGSDLGVAVATGDAIGFSAFEISLSMLTSYPRLSGKLPLVLTPGSATPLLDLARLLRWGMLERGFEPRSRPSDAFHLTSSTTRSRSSRPASTAHCDSGSTASRWSEACAARAGTRSSANGRGGTWVEGSVAPHSPAVIPVQAGRNEVRSTPPTSCHPCAGRDPFHRLRRLRVGSLPAQG